MSITRRNLLMGCGITLGLPFLPSLQLFAADKIATGPQGKPPKRLIFMSYGFGMSDEFYPDTTQGEKLLLTETMSSLNAVRDDMTFISNLSNLHRTDPHWGCTTFLTCADVHRTPGRSFHNDMSCDQVAAKHLGNDVRFPAIHLTAGGYESGGYGPGLSLAWDERGNAIPALNDPQRFYDWLFGNGGMTPQQRQQLLKRQRSALDIVNDDAKSLTTKISKQDQQKVEEYFTLVRSIEKQLTREEQWLEKPKPKPTTKEPSSELRGTAEALAHFDLMVAALQTDSTRVITYRMPTDGILREFREEVGEHVGAHPMTHYGEKTSIKYKALRWREDKLCNLFAALVQKLKAVREADGSSLLDNTVIVMGSGIRKGHTCRNAPVLLAGGKAMGIRHNRHIVNKENETPFSNMWLGLLKQVGCPVDSFADSTEPLNLV